MELDEFGFLFSVHNLIRSIREVTPSSMFENHAKVNLDAMKEYIGKRLEQISAEANGKVDEDQPMTQSLENKNNKN